MTADKYALNMYLLQFRDDAVESAYREHVVERTRWYCRISWTVVILLAALFSRLNRRVFGEDSGDAHPQQSS